MTEINKIRIFITIMATIIAIDFAILTYIFPQHASILLTIEVILLPSIYIIGNYYVEEFIKKQYEEELNSIKEKVLELGDKYLKQKNLINLLKTRLKNETKKS
jgi:hypothetical protein